MADDLPEIPDGLTEREHTAAVMRMEHSKLSEIGARLGLSESRVCRILQKPHVVAFIRGTRAEAAAAAKMRAVKAADAAVVTLIEIMRNPKAPFAARVSAAKSILNIALPEQIELSGPEGAPVQTSTQIDAAALEGLGEEDLVQARALLGRIVR